MRDVLDASLDPALRDEVIFLWPGVEVVDSWISDNFHKQQKRIHKILLFLTWVYFAKSIFRD